MSRRKMVGSPKLACGHMAFRLVVIFILASSLLPALAEPIIPEISPYSITCNPNVAEMISQVREETVYNYTAELSGASPAIVGGEPYLITTRETDSGEPIEKATEYVYQHLQGLGLLTSYQYWDSEDLDFEACDTESCDYEIYDSEIFDSLIYFGRNVIGTLPGSSRPDEIVLITAHLDSICDDEECGCEPGDPAPGADDDASGCAAVMVAADILSQHDFERTISFVFFTGEEQDCYGSQAFASLARESGDDIVAVYNIDTIGYDSDDDGALVLHIREKTEEGYSEDLAIAEVFTNVVDTYGLDDDLWPFIEADGESEADHASFWDEGYPAVLAIEDDIDDYNPYTHCTTDTLENLNMGYFTAYVKATLGTAAEMAGPVA